MELEIECFVHSDETLEKRETGIKYSFYEMDTKLVTFYNIDAIEEYECDVSKDMFCYITSGGSAFTATKNYEEVKELIRNSLYVNK